MTDKQSPLPAASCALARACVPARAREGVNFGKFRSLEMPRARAQVGRKGDS